MTNRPCRSDCPAGDCAGCAFPPARRRRATPAATANEPMPARQGARDLETLRQRCVIDAETGCWVWKAAMSRSRSRKIAPSPRVWLPDANVKGAGVLMTAGRAAWLLAGRAIAPGQVVWRSVCNRPDCINPAHGVAVTRAEMHRGLAKAGVNRGQPHRAAVNLRNAMRMATPPERVREIEAFFATGALCKDVRARFGVSAETAASIRDGRHVHSSNRRAVIPLASIFAMGEAA